MSIPSSLVSSGCTPWTPTSISARWPASLIDSSTSCSALRTTSSIRPGWMRPSEISRSSATRAISRRIGLWHEMTTASGVSSIMISTPVAASIARMLRPSRPMMRPFISSVGSAITETVRSATNSPASRSIAIEMMRLARRSASSRASSSTIADMARRLVPRLPDHLLDQRALGFLAREAGDRFEPAAGFVDQRLMLGLFIGDRLFAIAHASGRAD